MWWVATLEGETRGEVGAVGVGGRCGYQGHGWDVDGEVLVAVCGGCDADGRREKAKGKKGAERGLDGWRWAV